MTATGVRPSAPVTSVVTTESSALLRTSNSKPVRSSGAGVASTTRFNIARSWSAGWFSTSTTVGSSGSVEIDASDAVTSISVPSAARPGGASSSRRRYGSGWGVGSKAKSAMPSASVSRTGDLGAVAVEERETGAGDADVCVAARLRHPDVEAPSIAVDGCRRERGSIVSQRDVVLCAKVVAEESEPERGGLDGERGRPHVGLVDLGGEAGDAVGVGQRRVLSVCAGVERRPVGEHGVAVRGARVGSVGQRRDHQVVPPIRPDREVGEGPAGRVGDANEELFGFAGSGRSGSVSGFDGDDGVAADRGHRRRNRDHPTGDRHCGVPDRRGDAPRPVGERRRGREVDPRRPGRVGEYGAQRQPDGDVAQPRRARRGDVGGQQFAGNVDLEWLVRQDPVAAVERDDRGRDASVADSPLGRGREFDDRARGEPGVGVVDAPSGPRRVVRCRRDSPRRSVVRAGGDRADGARGGLDAEHRATERGLAAAHRCIRCDRRRPPGRERRGGRPLGAHHQPGERDECDPGQDGGPASAPDRGVHAVAPVCSASTECAGSSRSRNRSSHCDGSDPSSSGTIRAPTVSQTVAAVGSACAADDVVGAFGRSPVARCGELLDEFLLAAVGGATLGWCIGGGGQPGDPTVCVGHRGRPGVAAEGVGRGEAVVQPAPVGHGQGRLAGRRARGEQRQGCGRREREMGAPRSRGVRCRAWDSACPPGGRHNAEGERIVARVTLVAFVPGRRAPTRRDRRWGAGAGAGRARVERGRPAGVRGGGRGALRRRRSGLR